MVFVAVYSALSSSNEDALTYAIVAALILAVFFGGWRLLERKRPTRVIGAIVVVALGAYFAARTGSAAAFSPFVWRCVVPPSTWMMTRVC